jgi:hypothetical protein
MPAFYESSLGITQSFSFQNPDLHHGLIAFAWVVIAVFLQRSEFEAQRLELHDHGEVMRLQAEQLRQTVEKLQKQSEQMQLSQKQRENDRVMQMLGDSYRRLVHLMYVVASLTKEASIRSETGDDQYPSPSSIFGAEAFYLDCGNRDEFEIATSHFLERLQVLADAFADADRLIELPHSKMDLLRTYLIGIRDRAKFVCDLGTRVSSDAEAIFPFSALSNVRRVLDIVIPQVEAWVRS